MLSGGHLWLALVLTMLISLFLGIGIPTLAAYAIVAIIVAPVLVRMGVPPLSAHFFVFWFAIFSTLTPPVAFASMAGAALAGGSFMKTSLEAFRLATAGFVLPYLIVFVTVLTLQSENLLGSVTILAAVPLALAALVVVLYNHFLVPTSVLERLLFALAASALFGHCFTGIYLLFVGGLLTFLVLTFWQWKRHRILKGGRG